MQQEVQNQITQMVMPNLDYNLMLKEQQIPDDYRDRRYQLDK
ncbi:MAG: hypothetical protein ACL7BU_05705 [Candidatus Phlomobacter fragariae]